MPKHVPEKLKPYLIWLAVTVAIKSISPSFSGLPGNLSSLFTGVILLYTPCIYFWYRREKMVFLRGKAFAHSLIWFLAVGSASIFLYVVYVKLSGGQFYREKAHLLSTNNTLRFWLSSFIVVALPEEFFFRGFLFERIEGSALTKIIVTSLLFSITHIVIGFSLIRLLTFLPGISLGYLRHKTGEIYTPTLLHNLFNLVHWMSSI
jgi:membrane protease YdiL (CAAX protease family)